MKKTTKDPATGQKKSSKKDSKKGEVMGNDKYMQFEATKQYLMSTGQLDGKTKQSRPANLDGCRARSCI